ncbi:MAG: hypothetical protein J5545_07060 [Bacteroidaceae bacterium]|nr:hypothetical protein [Bacteroidaceae bacterium]
MEDYTQVPEEERGVGEPYTYEDSLITMTYQFRDGVKPMGEKALQYLLGVRDSTIYFSDDIPSELLPKVGGYVTAGISRTLPNGLFHKVLAIERTSGMVGLTLTSAQETEIFEDYYLNLNFDDYDVGGFEMTDDTTEAGIEATRAAVLQVPHFEYVNDSTIIDWSFIDAAEQSPDGMYLGTRADEEPIINDEKDKKKSWKIECNLEPSIPIKVKGMSLKPSLSFDLESQTKVSLHQEIWQSQNKTVRVETTRHNVKGTLTASFGQNFTQGDTKWSDVKKLYEVYKVLSDVGKHDDDPCAVGKNIAEKNLYIPLAPGVPLKLRLRINIHADAFLGAIGKIEVDYTSKVEEITSVSINGKAASAPTKKLISEAKNDIKADIGGTAFGKVEATMSIGLMVGALGTGGGIEAGVGYSFQAGAELMFNIIDEVNVNTALLENSRLYFTYGPKIFINIFADVLGQNVGNIDVTPKSWNLQKTINWYLFPKIDNRNFATYGLYDLEYDDVGIKKINHIRHLTFSSGYLFPCFHREMTPVMRVYMGKGHNLGGSYTVYPVSYTTENGTTTELYNTRPSLTPKVMYNFEFSTPYKNNDVIYFVPGLLDLETNAITEYRSEEASMGTDGTAPYITHEECYQQSRNPLTDYWEYNGHEYDVFKIVDIVKVVNTDYTQELELWFEVNNFFDEMTYLKTNDCVIKREGDKVIKPGTYKVTRELAIPHERIVGVKELQLTVSPTVYYKDIDDKTKFKEGKKIVIKLNTGTYTNTHEYTKANFTINL